VVAFHPVSCSWCWFWFFLKGGWVSPVGGRSEMLICSSASPFRCPSHPLLPSRLARWCPAAFGTSLTGFALLRAANFPRPHPLQVISRRAGCLLAAWLPTAAWARRRFAMQLKKTARKTASLALSPE